MPVSPVGMLDGDSGGPRLGTLDGDSGAPVSPMGVLDGDSGGPRLGTLEWGQGCPCVTCRDVGWGHGGPRTHWKSLIELGTSGGTERWLGRGAGMKASRVGGISVVTVTEGHQRCLTLGHGMGTTMSPRSGDIDGDQDGGAGHRAER